MELPNDPVKCTYCALKSAHFLSSPDISVVVVSETVESILPAPPGALIELGVRRSVLPGATD
jgi:hypothetical protein